MEYPFPPLPLNETERLADVRSFRMLDTPPEEPFDGIVEIAASLFDVPFATVSLIEADRQWFKANHGIPFPSNSRHVTFCSHTILGTETMVVEDFALDPRFARHPHVVGEPKLRFYAGTPLVSNSEHCVGSLCVLDVRPRVFTSEQRRLLERLARQAIDALETRRLLDRIASAYQSAVAPDGSR